MIGQQKVLNPKNGQQTIHPFATNDQAFAKGLLYILGNKILSYLKKNWAFLQ